MTYEENSESKEEVVKVEGLTPSSKGVNVVVKAVSKSEIREVTSRRDFATHKVADAIVGDETGCLLMTLWDDNITKISDGDTISVKNGYINLFRGSMRLNVGRYGSYEIVEDSPISEVNTENNLSDKQYEQERRYSRPSSYGRRRSFQRRY